MLSTDTIRLRSSLMPREDSTDTVQASPADSNPLPTLRKGYAEKGTFSRTIICTVSICSSGMGTPMPRAPTKRNTLFVCNTLTRMLRSHQFGRIRTS